MSKAETSSDEPSTNLSEYTKKGEKGARRRFSIFKYHTNHEDDKPQTYTPGKEIGSGAHATIRSLIKHSAVNPSEKTTQKLVVKTALDGKRQEASELELELEHNALQKIHPEWVIGYTTGRLVMPFIEGEPIDTELLNSTTTHDEKIKILIALAQELKRIHNKGWLHLDLTADNILLKQDDGQWIVTIIDFGRAVKFPKETGQEHPTFQFEKIHEGFFPPETKYKENDEATYTEKTDIYFLAPYLFVAKPKEKEKAAKWDELIQAIRDTDPEKRPSIDDIIDMLSSQLPKTKTTTRTAQATTELPPSNTPYVLLEA